MEFITTNCIIGTRNRNLIIGCICFCLILNCSIANNQSLRKIPFESVNVQSNQSIFKTLCCKENRITKSPKNKICRNFDSHIDFVCEKVTKMTGFSCAEDSEQTSSGSIKDLICDQNICKQSQECQENPLNSLCCDKDKYQEFRNLDSDGGKCFIFSSETSGY